MARAQMTNIQCQVVGDQMTLTWEILFHGTDVTPPDRDIATVTLPDTTTKANARAAIRAATLARATALGYTVGSAALYTLEELFAGV